jgi:hypothetical protein
MAMRPERNRRMSLPSEVMPIVRAPIEFARRRGLPSAKPPARLARFDFETVRFSPAREPSEAAFCVWAVVLSVGAEKFVPVWPGFAGAAV